MANRRDKGTGALFKRADGYWVGGVQLPPGPDGKRRYKRIVRKDRNAAMAALTMDQTWPHDHDRTG